MNQVTTRSAGTAVAALQGLKKGIANVKATLVKKGGEPFLRLLKDGSWVYGQDDVEVEAGSAWAVNPLSIMHGWVAWERGDDADNSKGPEQDVMVPARLPLPAVDSLPKLARAQKYEQQFSFSMVCLTGEDKGEQVLYKTASVGGVAAVDTLLNAISAQLDDDLENPVPVIVLETDSYNHKKHGKTYTPILAIKTWRPLSEDLPDVQAELDEQQGDETETEAEKPAEPPKRTRKTSVPATGGKAADEDAELAALEAAIAKKKADKDAAKDKPAETDAERKKRELREQLAAMEAEEAGDGDGAEQDPEDEPAKSATQPLRRRRNV